MKKKLIIFLILSSLILTGFTVIDYDEYWDNKPIWIWDRELDEPVYRVYEVKSKIEIAQKELEKKGFEMEDVKVYISPVMYPTFYGSAAANEVVIANNSYNTIYHELAHVYANKHKDKDIIKKYERLMKHYYPDHVPSGTSWHRSISEDFAEEFKQLFTGSSKRTDYPNFPNFYEWLLRNTQQVEVTREEAFDKLGGTKELIDQGIVIGNTKGDFMLDKTLTRAELATVLVRIKGLNKEKKVPFTDIKNKWYEPYVKKIYNEGLIKGYPDNTFRGNNKITRYELHLILERLNTQK